MKTELSLVLTVIVYVSLGVSGELLLSRAMRKMPPGNHLTPSGALRMARYVITTPLVILGTLLLALNFLMLVALLSKLEVSVIVPSHAASYLLVALTARYLLHEAVSPRRWIGVLLITAGVSLVLTSRVGEPLPRAPLRSPPGRSAALPHAAVRPGSGRPVSASSRAW